MSITFEDAVTASNLAPGRYGVYYADGQYANETAVRDRLGSEAVLQSITVTPSLGFDICDCETSDLTPAEAVGWVEQSLAAGRYRPCVYADASTWNDGLFVELAKYGNRIRRWVASYPGTGDNIPAGYDAHQWSTGDVDKNIALDNFFDTKPAPDHPNGIARVELSLDLADGVWRTHSLPGNPTWGPDEEWDSVEIQVCRGGARKGQWRHASLSLNSNPLGG